MIVLFLASGKYRSGLEFVVIFILKPRFRIWWKCKVLLIRMGQIDADSFCFIRVTSLHVTPCAGSDLRIWAAMPRAFSTRQTGCCWGRPWWIACFQGLDLFMTFHSHREVNFVLCGPPSLTLRATFATTRKTCSCAPPTSQLRCSCQ